MATLTTLQSSFQPTRATAAQIIARLITLRALAPCRELERHEARDPRRGQAASAPRQPPPKRGSGGVRVRRPSALDGKAN